jgi:hypothetical protein
MPPQDLLNELRRRPFVPFRLHVDDGTIYEVRHPELMIVGLASAIVGFPVPGDPRFYERYDLVDLRHIARLEPRPDLAVQQSPPVS